MRLDEHFSATIATALLKSADEEIQAEVLSDLIERSNQTQVDLDEQLSQAIKSEKKAGDFGMEIVGPLIIPVLIEAGKELWKLYIKKLGEKAAGKLADMTASKATKLAHSIWTGEEALVSVTEYEERLKKAAVGQGLTAEQTEKLVAAVKNKNMKDLLTNE